MCAKSSVLTGARVPPKFPTGVLIPSTKNAFILQRYYLYDMNIAIASTFHPYRGGIAAFNDRLAKTLESDGHTVKTFNWKRQYPSYFSQAKPKPKMDTIPHLPVSIQSTLFRGGG